MVIDVGRFKLISWTTPTPRGLWYRGLILTPRGIFITPELDVVSMDSIAAAIEVGPEEVLPLLTGHGRFKRCEFLPLDSIKSISANGDAGTIHFTTKDKDKDKDKDKETFVRVPDRKLQVKMAAAVSEFVRRARSAPSAE